MDDRASPNYGVAYEQSIQEWGDVLRAARSEARYNPRTGHRSTVYVPSKMRHVFCEFLSDRQIREVAQRESEIETNLTINKRNEQHAT